ncbi:MAG TPA: hypothetical protein DDW73_23635 [Rhizobium sp.]|nr:hypothetical protein [Rhizobium sp.]
MLSKNFNYLTLLIFSLVNLAASANAANLAPSCWDEKTADTTYHICKVDPLLADIRVYNEGADGTPLRSFDSLIAQLAKEGRSLLFATNGGMYEHDLSPVGLFVSQGITRKPATTLDGWGNFFLKPNGVFYLKDGKAAVMETQHFLNLAIQPEYATQSGPMLVVDGTIHPRFLPDSDSLKIRNGVGVDQNGQVLFAISNAPVRFYDMAVFFRDQLATPNALFLDGTISSIAEPASGRIDRDYPLGTIIAVIGDAQQ